LILALFQQTKQKTITQGLKLLVMKKTNIFYWVFTGLLAFLMLGSAIPDIISHPVAVKGMHEDLGYPVYFIPFLGVAKFLGVVAILTPGFHRLKEFAYAGFYFDLIGATYSIFMVGKPDWMFNILPIALLTASYVFYVKRRKLQQTGVVNSQVTELRGVAF
jgi:hypothetical protein